MAHEYEGNMINEFDSDCLSTTWQPIETAPKDRPILLYTKLRGVVCGYWQDDKYSKNPRPYWSNDLERLFGRTSCRGDQPTHWMKLPEKPCDENEVIE